MDAKNGYVLDQEVTINAMLKDKGMESANGVRTPIGNDCNEIGPEDSTILRTAVTYGEGSVKVFNLWLEVYSGSLNAPDRTSVLPSIEQHDIRTSPYYATGRWPSVSLDT